MQNFKDKIALVTGAASGIGRATALELARHGAHLVLADLNETGLASVSREIEAMGRKTLCVAGDISKKQDVSELAKEAVTKMGHVDLLYNNAGVMFLGETREMKLTDWEWIVGINLWGPVRLTHALLPHMIERGSGHIVTTASMAGIVGVPGLAAYSLTKFAMVGFSEALRAEVARHGIDVSVVCPAVVKSGITEGGRYGSDSARKSAFDGMASRMPYPTEKAAKDIVRGIRKNRGHIVLAPGASTMWNVKRLSPELMYRVNRWLWERYGSSMGLGH